ncbi:lytic murein transglycosylase [Neotabrizicola shimadae]|uniref:Lytic murein transglycosylase n=1 Tax=Neotabrizicola shimadae TaxID=2807096 RepID=A0A8G0ZUV0_9RHOB|nr:lytic murein transglycosylase [Neotabrizicola shimadae]
MRTWLLAAVTTVFCGPALAESLPPPELVEGRAVKANCDATAMGAWVQGFRPKALAAGITPEVFDAALAGVAPDPRVLERDYNQTEFTKTIWDYLDRAVSPDRVAGGQKALKVNAALLGQIEAQYGVPKEIVVAIWGLESDYGAFRGDFPLMDSLATLACGGRRAAFWEGEVLAALRILQAGDVTPAAMQGSWAGAMGHTQFMPSSYLRLAVDFDGDGRRDIWGDDPTDALASTAAYLAASGWVRGQPWGLEVTLPEGFDYRQSGEGVFKPPAEWRALGVAPVGGGELPAGGLAELRLPGGWRGAAFLTFGNFKAIEAYNLADAYVIAVGHLSDRIAGGPPIAAGWPREDRALVLEERVELQQRLTDAGFDTGGVDGRIGPKTIRAMQAWQEAQGLPPDGYASLAALDALR